MTRLLQIAIRITPSPGSAQKQIRPSCTACMGLKSNALPRARRTSSTSLGVKVGIVSTSKESFVLAARSLPGNPYDCHTLQACIDQSTRVTGVAPHKAYADREYKGHGCNSDSFKVWISGSKRGVTKAIERKPKRHNAAEPVIDHLKSDGRLPRNFLRGVESDAMNACCVVLDTTCARFSESYGLFYALWEFTVRQLLALLLPPAIPAPITALKIHKQHSSLNGEKRKWGFSGMTK